MIAKAAPERSHRVHDLRRRPVRHDPLAERDRPGRFSGPPADDGNDGRLHGGEPLRLLKRHQGCVSVAGPWRMRPGRAAVMAPFSKTTWPFTMTVETPSA